MKIGRGIAADGAIVTFALDEDNRRVSYDPATGRTGAPVSLARTLAPTAPTKIVAVGLNYRDHAREMDLAIPTEPLLFLKPASCVIGPADAIVYPPQSGRVDYEAELAVVIGKRCTKVSATQAAECVLGYTCLNDVTARDLQARDGQWTRAKSFDTFAPLGPWIETAIADPHHLDIRLRLNGEVRQTSNTANLIFGVFELIAYISAVMTLEPGDVIATGTPAGVGPMQRGDTVSVEIESIGILENKVV